VVWGLEGVTTAVGHCAGNFGDYYADYCNVPESYRVVGKKGGNKHYSGAKSTPQGRAADQFPPPAAVYVPETSTMHKMAGLLGSTLSWWQRRSRRTPSISTLGGARAGSRRFLSA